MLARETKDAIFKQRQMFKKHGTAGGKLYMVLVDLEKAFNRFPIEMIWLALKRKSAMEMEVIAITKINKTVKNICGN